MVRGINRLPLVLAVLALVVSPAPAPAQEPVEPAAAGPADPGKRLLKAVEDLEDKPFVVHGSVAIEKPANDLFGGGGRIVVSHGGGSGAPSYEGDLEAFTDGEGTLIVVSDRAIPGFEAYRSGEREVTRLTFAEDPISAGRVVSDLEGILDMGNLRRWIRKADLIAEVDAEAGTVRYTGELSSRLVPSRTGDMVAAMLSAKVLRVKAVLLVARDGRLTEMEIRVVCSDPVSGMLRGGGGAFGSRGTRQSDTEGATSVYKLRLSRGDPSPRALAFRRAVESQRKDGK